MLGNAKVVVFDTKLEKSLVPLLLQSSKRYVSNKIGAYLFVANANDNSVSVIDTRKLSVIETLNSALIRRTCRFYH